MSTQQDTTHTGRRAFLRTALAAGLSVAAVVMAHKGVTTAAATVENPQQQEGKQGYRLTPHINDYYNSAAR